MRLRSDGESCAEKGRRVTRMILLGQTRTPPQRDPKHTTTRDTGLPTPDHRHPDPKYYSTRDAPESATRDSPLHCMCVRHAKRCARCRRTTLRCAPLSLVRSALPSCSDTRLDTHTHTRRHAARRRRRRRTHACKVKERRSDRISRPLNPKRPGSRCIPARAWPHAACSTSAPRRRWSPCWPWTTSRLLPVRGVMHRPT